MLLIIDTSLGTSVGVSNKLGQVYSQTNPSRMHHAELIGDYINQVIHEAKIKPTELDGVVLGMGPGPFTGLRVGIAAGFAFAKGANLPLFPVMSLDFIAWQLGGFRPGQALDFLSNSTICAEEGLKLVICADAKRREMFCADYEFVPYRAPDAHPNTNLVLQRIAEPYILATEKVTTQNNVFVATDFVIDPAAAIALAEHRIANTINFASEEAIYLRSPDVTLSKGPKRVSR